MTRNTTTYLGRSASPGKDFDRFDLSLNGKPIPWGRYADRLLAMGYRVERVAFITEPHPRPDFDGETITRRVLLAVESHPAVH